MIEEAIKFLDAELSVIPVDVKTKRPTVKAWTPYQKERMSIDVAKDAFNENSSIAIIGGEVSGGLICLDFDQKFGDIDAVMSEYCDHPDVKSIIKEYDLPIESSPSGGFHLMFKSDLPMNNRKLARKEDSKGRPVSFIETRGDGGYVIVAPSNGYEMIQGDMKVIRKIPLEDAKILIEVAEAFDEYLDPRDMASTSKETIGSERPGEAYDKSREASDECKNILREHGWKSTNGIHWTRSGKEKGVSATLGKVAENVFYVFSTNAHPFLERKGYSPWQILGLLKHNGNFDEAAKELSMRGFGNKKTYPKLKSLLAEAHKKNRMGQYFAPKEINDLAEELDIPVTIANESVRKVINENKDEFGYDKKSSIEKAEIFIKKKYEFRDDIISKLTYMKINGKKWEGINPHTISRDLQHNRINFPSEKLSSLLKSDFVPRYNPFVDYFDNLPKYDGKVDYIKKLSTYFSVNDHEYFAKMLEKAIVRNITCALQPNYYNRIVFTLIGERQEIGKSYFIQWLNPFGHEYYTDEPLKDGKDSRLSLTENFIYNLEELDSLSKIDIGRLKATISTRGVKDRLPYAATKEYFPRCCSFWGSTNRHEFLVDDRNTRWLCFSVEDIDWNYSKDINIRDIWIQAWNLYKTKGYNFNLTKAEAAKRDVISEEHKIVDLEVSILTEHFEDDPNAFMSNTDVLKDMATITEGKIKFTNNAVKIGRILAQMGYARKRKGSSRGWGVKRKNSIIPSDMPDGFHK